MGIAIETACAVCGLHMICGLYAFHEVDCDVIFQFELCVVIVDFFMILYLLTTTSNFCSIGDVCIVIIWEAILITLSIYGVSLLHNDCNQMVNDGLNDGLNDEKYSQQLYFAWTMTMPFFEFFVLNTMAIVKLCSSRHVSRHAEELLLGEEV